GHGGHSGAAHAVFAAAGRRSAGRAGRRAAVFGALVVVQPEHVRGPRLHGAGRQRVRPLEPAGQHAGRAALRLHRRSADAGADAAQPAANGAGADAAVFAHHPGGSRRVPQGPAARRAGTPLRAGALRYGVRRPPSRSCVPVLAAVCCCFLLLADACCCLLLLAAVCCRLLLLAAVCCCRLRARPRALVWQFWKGTRPGRERTLLPRSRSSCAHYSRNGGSGMHTAARSRLLLLGLLLAAGAGWLLTASGNGSSRIIYETDVPGWRWTGGSFRDQYVALLLDETDLRRARAALPDPVWRQAGQQMEEWLAAGDTAVVVAYLGEASTGGYAIRIVRVEVQEARD